jgi:5'-3' exonuclease
VNSGLLVIDGTGLQVRCQLASPRDDEHGDLALFFFVRSVIRFISYHKPEYIVVAWDGPGAKDWRREKYPDYKRNRPDGSSGHASENNIGFRAEVFCKRLDMFSIRGPFEADDIISWAVWAAQREAIDTIFIRSDDHDMNQLVSPFVTQYPLSAVGEPTTQGAVVARYGCAPVFLPKLRALAGDTSDNIPGVPGIGIKTAAKILAEAHYDLRQARHPKLHDMREQVFIFEIIMDLLQRREAVETWLPPPPSIRLRSCWHPERSLADARVCFENWGMNSLVKALDNGSLW